MYVYMYVCTKIENSRVASIEILKSTILFFGGGSLGLVQAFYSSSVFLILKILANRFQFIPSPPLAGFFNTKKTELEYKA